MIPFSWLDVQFFQCFYHRYPEQTGQFCAQAEIPSFSMGSFTLRRWGLSPQQMQFPRRILSQFPAGDIEHQASLGMHKHRSSSCQMEPGKVESVVSKLDPRILSKTRVFSWTFHPQLLEMYPWNCSNGSENHENVTKKRTNILQNHPSTAEQKLEKNYEPHLVLPIPDELEGLLKRLGVALPWVSTSNKATVNFRLDIPKFSAKQRGWNHFITRRYKMCISHYIYFPDSWEVSLFFFLCQGTSFHQQLVSAAWLKLGEHYAQGGDCGALWLSNSRAEPKWPTKWETRKLDQNRLQTHSCGSFQRYQ